MTITTTKKWGPKARSSFGSASRFCETFLSVRTEKGAIVPLRWRPVQRYIRREKARAVKAGRPRRFLITKARRMGVTTGEQGDSYARICNLTGQYCLTLADVREKAGEIFDISNLFYEKHHPEMRPRRPHENGTRIVFPDLGSKHVIGTAGAINVARGLGIQKVHGSEVAFWLEKRHDPSDLDNLVVGLTEAASHGEVTFESTANGNSGWWYETCMEASRGEGEWTLIFLPWFIDPRYAIPLSRGDREQILDTIDDRERWLMEEKGCTLGQIKWRRTKRLSKAMRKKWAQEYPEILDESFMARGVAYFDPETLTKLTQYAQEPYESMNGIEFYVPPDPARRYVAGLDVAEGVEGGDYNVCSVIDYESGVQVARGRWLIRPEDAATRAVRLARRYNWALLGIERHGIGEAAINQAYQKLHYPNLYHERVMSVDRKSRKKIGWETNAKTRAIMIEDLAEAMEEGWMIANDTLFLQECRVFEDDGTGRYEARPGMHDDIIFANAIAWQVKKRGIVTPEVHVL